MYLCSFHGCSKSSCLLLPHCAGDVASLWKSAMEAARFEKVPLSSTIKKCEYLDRRVTCRYILRSVSIESPEVRRIDVRSPRPSSLSEAFRFLLGARWREFHSTFTLRRAATNPRQLFQTQHIEAATPPNDSLYGRAKRTSHTQKARRYTSD